MAPDLPSNLFLTAGSAYDAAVQLFYKLPGQYRLVRRIHHSHIVNGTNLPYRYLICPSHGTSTVTLRAPTDHFYEMELLQTTIVNLRTWTGQSATKVEKRAFRIRNGQWSLWTVEGFDVIGRKLADLTIREVRAPHWDGSDMVQKVELNGGPWRDGWGVNVVEVWVWLGRQVRFQDLHMVDKPGNGAIETCIDDFGPVVDDGGRV